MNEQLSEYTDDQYWVHLTLPTLLGSIEKDGLETGHLSTEEQLFSEYFPDSDQNDVIEVREYAESLLEKVRKEVHGNSPTFSSRGSCVALWPGVRQAHEMRSAVLGDSVEYGVVVVDAEAVDSSKLVLSEYQLIAQTMMHANMYREGHGEIDSDELVEPAWKYWRTASLTNSWEAVADQASMFDIPEILVNGGIGADAIVETLTLEADPYDDANDDAPPSVSPE